MLNLRDFRGLSFCSGFGDLSLLSSREESDVYRDPLARLVVVDAYELVAKTYLIRLVG